MELSRRGFMTGALGALGAWVVPTEPVLERPPGRVLYTFGKNLPTPGLVCMGTGQIVDGMAIIGAGWRGNGERIALGPYTRLLVQAADPALGQLFIGDRREGGSREASFQVVSSSVFSNAIGMWLGRRSSGYATRGSFSWMLLD